MILDPTALTRRDLYAHMIGLIVPRPIAFVSSVSRDGRLNLAPFSFFNGVTSKPPLISISIQSRRGAPKDTLVNVRDTGEFVVNVVDEPLLERMVRTSGEWPPEADEFALAGLTPAPSEVVRVPRVAESPACFECRLHREVELGDSALVIGEILRIHVADRLFTDGRVDPEKLRPVGRLGGDGYTLLGELRHVARPRLTPPGA